jgi:hypothetical protein
VEVGEMTSRDFVYWLQGFFELDKSGPKRSEKLSLTPEQTETIRRHLALVFKHEIDPGVDDGDQKLRENLQAIHDGAAMVETIGGELYPGGPLIRC